MCLRRASRPRKFRPAEADRGAHDTVSGGVARTRPRPGNQRRRAVALDDYGRARRRDSVRGFAAAALALLDAAQVSLPPRSPRSARTARPSATAPQGAHPFTLQIGDRQRDRRAHGHRHRGRFPPRRRRRRRPGRAAAAGVARGAVRRCGDRRARSSISAASPTSRVLAPGRAVLGFDTGPANCLLDAWAVRHLGTPCDEGGAWAAAGASTATCCARCWPSPILAAPPPKSTGRECSTSTGWTRACHAGRAPADVQATLLAFTARSIADALRAHGRRRARGLRLRRRRAQRRADAGAAPRTPGAARRHHGARSASIRTSSRPCGFAWLARATRRAAPATAARTARAARVLGAVYRCGCRSRALTVSEQRLAVDALERAQRSRIRRFAGSRFRQIATSCRSRRTISSPPSRA